MTPYRNTPADDAAVRRRARANGVPSGLPYDPDVCAECGHDPDAHDMRALDSTCSDCPDVSLPCYHPSQRRITARAIRAAIVQDFPTLPIVVEQTGGGTATMYVGAYDADGRALLSIGPGSYDWREPWESTFHLDELSIGPDPGPDPEGFNDTGVGEYVATLDALVAYARAVLA